MRATPARTIGEINTRVLNEDAAIRAISTKVPSGQQAIRVGNKGRRTNKICKNYGFPHPKGHLSEECWFKFPELNAKFQSKKRESDETATRLRNLYPAPRQNLRHCASKV